MNGKNAPLSKELARFRFYNIMTTPNHNYTKEDLNKIVEEGVAKGTAMTHEDMKTTTKEMVDKTCE